MDIQGIDKEWIEKYVKIYKYFDLYQSFPFDKKEDIEWLLGEMKKKKEGILMKEKKNLFEFLDGFDWEVYDVVMKERKKEDDGKLSFEFEMKNSRDKDSFRRKRKMTEIKDNKDCRRIKFEWDYDTENQKYPFKDIDNEIHLRIKIKNPWIEKVKHDVDTHYYLLYENERIIEEDCDKTRLENAIMHDLFEYHNLNHIEKNELGLIEDGKLSRNSNYRIYEYIYVPIYKKNQKSMMNIEKERKERYQEFCKRKERGKIKRDMNLFLKYYFYDEL